MSKQTNPNRTCADCLHFSACHLWERSISTSVAPKCPQFEDAIYVTLTDLHNMYLIHKGDLVPVVHARCVKNPYNGRTCCSACKVPLPGVWYYNYEDEDENYEEIDPTPYCPNCNARMDGGADNGT